MRRSSSSSTRSPAQLLMLLAIMAMYWTAGTTDITVLLEDRVRAEDADLAVARLLRLLRGEDADVAGAHLAARRACRSADRGFGDPGRHSPQDGRLRLHPLLAADVPRRLALFHPAHLRAVGDCDHLHLAGRAGAGQHEEADRLFVGRPYGLRDDGHLRRQHAGRSGRGLSDDQPRPRLGRALPLRRRRLRPHA